MSDEITLADKLRICTEIVCAIANVAVISPLAAARIVRAIERGEIPALRINYGGETNAKTEL